MRYWRNKGKPWAVTRPADETQQKVAPVLPSVSLLALVFLKKK
jgi:hypothetical protein